jgi:3-hydroxyisobutyrate dehydrogenase
MLKDLKLAQLSAGSAGAATPMGALAASLYQGFAEQGRGQLDFSAIVTAIRAHSLADPGVAAE